MTGRWKGKGEKKGAKKKNKRKSNLKSRNGTMRRKSSETERIRI